MIKKNNEINAVSSQVFERIKWYFCFKINTIKKLPMNKSTKRSTSHIWISIPFIFLFGILLFARSIYFEQQAAVISQYLILDLLITIPVVYFLTIQKTNIPKITVVPVIILDMLIGYYVIPEDQQFYLDLFRKYAFPLLEGGVFLFVVFKIRKTVKTFKSNNSEEMDFYEVMRKTCEEILPGRLSHFLLSEISVFYYGFVSWSKPELKEGDFTYHKRSGSPALFGALIFIILVETFAVHVVLLKWSSLAAMMLTVISIYTAIQFFGFSKSLARRPISVKDGKLYLRYGIMSEAVIEIDEIESIELSRKALKKDDNMKKLSLLGELESHNVIIHCKEMQTLNGFYGMKKSFKSLALHLDEKERFKTEVDRLLMV